MEPMTVLYIGFVAQYQEEVQQDCHIDGLESIVKGDATPY